MSLKDDINKRLSDLLKKAGTNADRLIARQETELVKAYKRALAEIKKKIAAIYEKYGDDVQYSDLVSYNRLTNLEQQIADEVKKLTKENISTTTKAIKDIYSEQFYRVGFAFEQSLGARLGFGLLNPDVIKASVLNSLDRIKWTDRMKDHAQQFINQIQSELTQGLIQGEGYGKISKRIIDKTGINAGKVIRIVRTEGHRVQSAGRLLAYDKTQAAADRLGLKTVKVWVATLDNRTRDSHQQMDGKEANDEGIFTLPSGATTEAPGLSGVAEEDINCRCTTIMQFKDFPPAFRKDNETKQIIEYKNNKNLTNLKTNLNYRDDYTGGVITRENQRMIESKLSELTGKHGVTVDNLTTSKMGNGYFASTSYNLKTGESTIDLNSTYFSDRFDQVTRDGWMKNAFKDDWFYGDKAEDFITHEYGHVLTYSHLTKIGKTGDEIKSLLDNIKIDLPSISRYSKLNFGEFSAELFVKYTNKGFNSLSDKEQSVLKGFLGITK